MSSASSRSQHSLIEILTYLVNNISRCENLSSADLMLLICGITLGAMIPQMSITQLGPAIIGFFTEIDRKLYRDIVKELSFRLEEDEPLVQVDVDTWLEKIHLTGLESKLRDIAFQLELRNLLTRFNLLPNLVAHLSEQTAQLVIEAMNTQVNLLTVYTVNALSEVLIPKRPLATQVKHLAGLVTQANGARIVPSEPSPPAGHVFISYSHIDGEDLAHQLHDSLMAEKIEVWLDYYDIRPGEEWDMTIQKAIEDCQLFILIVTPSSVRSGVCRSEYIHALSTQKIIVCAIWKEAPIPFLLNTKQYIDFRLDFKEALTKLYLALQQDFDELSINLEQAARQEHRAVESIKAEAQDRDKRQSAHSIFINTLPLDVSERFIDRIKEQAEILSLLLKKSRLISIYGRSGVGKTALACKVLGDLQISHNSSHVDGMIYLSASNTDTTDTGMAEREISLARIFTDISKLLTTDAGHTLEAALKDVQMPTRQKVAVLLNELRGGHYVLLLDNLESLQDPETGELAGPDLRTFFEMVLERGSSLSIVVTSRVPLTLPHQLKILEYMLPLEKGLPIKDAIDLLRTLDTQGFADLQKASTKKLKIVAEKTRGFPRALEAVVGLLLMDKLSNLDDLLNSGTLLADEVTKVIVQQAIVRLRPDAIRVMEALAIFGRRVTQSALEFLLAPYMATDKLRSILNQLVGAYFVDYNKTTQTFGLHPIDSEYCYYRIPEGSASEKPKPGTLPPYSRYALNHLAADYYTQIRTPSNRWKTITDLEPQIAEFEHRLKAADYNSAARLLNEIDTDYLTLWGHARQVLTMRERLLDRITDRWLESTNLGYLGRAYCELGQYRQAIRYAEQALDICHEMNEKRGQAINLGVLGRSYRVLGEYEQAISYLNQAFTIACDLGEERDQVSYLANLGNAWRNLGDCKQAIEYHQQALSIARKIEDRRGESYNLLNLGATHYEMGEIEQAKVYYKQTLEIVRKISDKRRETDVLGNLGIAYRALGQHEQAADYFKQALEVARKIGDRRWEGLWLDNLGLIYHYLGQYKQAIKCREESLTIVRQIKARRAEGYSLAGLGKTYMALGHLDDALDKLSEAFEIATTSKNPRDHQCWGTLLALCYLLKGRFSEASEIMADIRQHVVPENDYYAAEVDGIIRALNHQEEAARDTFNEALSLADALLAKTPLFYSAKYTRGLALFGLAILSEGDEREILLIQTQEAYDTARSNCASPGVIADAWLLLNSLQPLDKNGMLMQIKKVLMRALPEPGTRHRG